MGYIARSEGYILRFFQGTNVLGTVVLGALNGLLALFGGLCNVLLSSVFSGGAQCEAVLQYIVQCCALAYYPSGGTDRIAQTTR